MSQLPAEFPTFQGRLLFNQEALQRHADDFGHIVKQPPLAVLRAGSTDDIVSLVRAARRHGIPVAARGQGHSTFGQSQSGGGIIIDMAALNRVEEVTATGVWADAGALWRDVLRHSLPRGLRPPVLIDYLDVTVAGPLSVGGISGQSHRHGAQTDNLLALQVVTGAGELITCSATEHRELFDACRGGAAQCGIITRAHLRLIAAPSHVRFYQVLHEDLQTFLFETTALVDEERFDALEAFAVPGDRESIELLIGKAETARISRLAEPKNGTPWLYYSEAAKYFDDGALPDDEKLLAGLSFPPGNAVARTMTYQEYCERLDPFMARQRELGLLAVPHPWIDLFVPGPAAPTLIAELLRELTLEDVAGEAAILLYPLRRSLLQTPFLRLPDSSHIVLFGMLFNALPPTKERVEQMLQRNRSFFERVVAVGGKVYPINSVRMTAADWVQHYDPQWGDFAAVKRRFDPDGILGHGWGIFAGR